MARPELVTKYRGVGQTENEVFQSAGGTLVSLFTYGTAGLQADVDHKPGALATHWSGKIYAISPEEGIYVNTPPSSSATLLHSFTLPNTSTNSFCMDWQTVFKDGKTQLFTLYLTTTSNQIRMVFIDEDGVVTETGQIPIDSPALNISYMRGLNFGNKIYTSSQTSSNLDVQVTDPEAESTNQINIESITWVQSDLAIHSGNLFLFSTKSVGTIGEGHAIWNMESAVPYKLIEWNAYNSPGISAVGQNCIFSDGPDLFVVGVGSGSLVDEFDVWRVDFDGNGTIQGLTSVRDTVFGFDKMVQVEGFRCYASRDLESTPGIAETNLHITPSNGSIEGAAIHHYKWNGVNTRATYLGVGGDSFSFDAPSWKVGGGSKTFTSVSELDFIVTDVAPTGSNVDITYLITGSAPESGVAMSVVYNNLKDSPTSIATVSPITNGFSSGNYIAGLSTGQSGVFRWNISADGVVSTNVTNLSSILIRTL